MSLIIKQSSAALYKKYVQRLQKIADVKYAAAVLQWDQETYMPAKGADYRAQQLATLSEITHQLYTQTSFKKILLQLKDANDLSDEQQKNIALSWYDYTQQEKLTPAFVRKLSTTVSKSFQAWMQARSKNKFSLFQKDLSALVKLKQQEADMLGYEAHAYNALINQYEKDCTVAELDRVFDALQIPLQKLLTQIAAQPQMNDAVLQQNYPATTQWQWGLDIMKQMGFDFEAGRQDKSEHPFTTNFSSQDVRLTTRIDENDFSNMTWSCIHELGHGLYEQGLPATSYGLPLGEYASLSIHESQSRLWENNVGRSRAAWHYLLPIAQKYFPQQLGGTTPESFYKAINKVSPSLIRTEADELTYHFHVIIRYQLEKALISGQLPVKEIPAFWNQHYHQYLGVIVPNDKQGCLQDVHWSHGSFGYFPTYSLGSLYAAQFFAAAKKQVPALEEGITKGHFQPLLEWLRTNVHAHGRRYNSQQLCQLISGEALNIDYFISYALDKYQNIYEF
jgi:carboxypeptidase Taq